MRTTRISIILCVLTVSLTGAFADESHLTKAIDTSLQAATYGMPVVRLLDKNPVRRETGRRMADALLINAAITGLLKATISSPRPHGGDDGFPSGHTSAAFAAAASLVTREPKLTWVALPLAATAGWARVDLEKHTWAQVLAGAALGGFVGHMCGSGQWRLFGHKNAPVEVPTSFEGLSDQPSALAEPLPPLNQLSLAWGTTLWSTSF